MTSALGEVGVVWRLERAYNRHRRSRQQWGGAVGVVWGQNGPAIGVGSDVSIERSGRGLEA